MWWLFASIEQSLEDFVCFAYVYGMNANSFIIASPS